MTTWYQLTIDVPQEKLATVIDVLSAEGRNLGIKEIETPNGAAQAPVAKRKRTVKRARKGEPTPGDLIMQMFLQNTTRTVTIDQACEQLERNGYARTTAYGVMGGLINSGRVKQLTPRVYAYAANGATPG